MMNVSKFANTCVAVLVLIIGANVAHAGQVWGSSSGSCMPGDPAIQNNRYTIQSGKVSHTSTNVDLITLYCAVHSGGFASHLWVSYRDSDGTGANTFVDAQFIKMNRTTGALTTIGTFLSSSFSSTGFAQNFISFPVEFFDASTYVYYVRIDMDRGSTSDTAIWYSASLEN